MKSELKKYRKTLKALSHPLASDILLLILKNKKMNVGVIYKTLKIEQSVCSTMLRQLRDAKLVTAVKISREMHYKVNKDHVRTLLNSLRKEICGN